MAGDPSGNGWTKNVEEIEDIRRRAYSASLAGESREIEALIDQRYWLLRKTIEHWRTALCKDFAPPGNGARAETTTSAPVDAKRAFPELVFDLAVVDLFVEKAQQKLTERATKHRREAGLYLIGALAILGLLAALLIGRTWLPELPRAAAASDPWSQTIQSILLTSGIAGVFFGAVYLFVMLARASFHEATILLNRRHSVRLGRLLMYLKLTSASTAHELQELKREMSSSEMESIFSWNLQSSTAFRDIKGEAATSTLLGQVLQTVQKGLEAFGRKP